MQEQKEKGREIGLQKSTYRQPYSALRAMLERKRVKRNRRARIWMCVVRGVVVMVVYTGMRIKY